MAAKLFKRSFIIIWLVNFFLYLSYTMINPSLPIYFESIGSTSGAAGLCVGMFTLGSILVRPLAGTILDRFGRRTVFFVSTILLSCIIFSYSFASTVLAIALLRIVHGFDWGFASTSTNTLASDTIPRQMIGKGIALFSISMSFAIAGAPTLAVFLMERYEFSGMMKISSGFVLLGLVLSLLYPFSEHHKKPMRHITPHRYHFKKEAMFERSALLPAIIICCITMTMTAVITYVPAYSIALNLDGYGAFFIFYAIGLISIRLFIGNIVDHFGVKAATLPTLFSLITALILLAFTGSLPMLLASGLFYGIGYGGSQSTLQSLAVMNASSNHYGAANATFFIGFDFGYGIGALLAGILSDIFGYSVMYFLLTIFLVLAIILMIKLYPKQAHSKS